MATENVEDGAKPSSSNETDGSLERKIGLAKKFDKEMKDYAKATVKEFLGIYGYEEDVDINMDDSGEAHKTGAATNVESSKESGTSSETNQPSRPTLGESASTTAAPTTNSFDMERGTTGPQETSVSISSSTNGNANMTRFCITMSIPRNGADSEQGYTTLRFWNCIMCSTAFVGCKPEIVQRIHYPHLFTYQPEWLSHAGICTRCQNALTMRSPKITIYAINETPQYHHSYTIPPASVPVVGQMCNAFPGECNCSGVHGQVPAVVPMVYTVNPSRNLSDGSNVPVENGKTETVPSCTEAPHVTHVTKKPTYVFRPITCTQ